MSENTIENVNEPEQQKLEQTLPKKVLKTMLGILENERDEKPKPFSITSLVKYLNMPIVFLFYPFKMITKNESTRLLETTPYYKKIWWFIALIILSYVFSILFRNYDFHSNYASVVVFIWINMFIVLLYFLHINKKHLVYNYNVV